MKNALYAMDTYFMMADRAYPFAEQCALARELGFDRSYRSLDDATWTELPDLPAIATRAGLPLSAVYACLDIDTAPAQPSSARLLDAVKILPAGMTLELGLLHGKFGEARSDPAHDAKALAWLARLLAAGEDNGVVLSLYPHFGFWQEKLGDCLRLIRAAGHPRLRATFCGYHWAVSDGAPISALIRDAAPHLHRVNLCGSTPGRTTDGLPASIEPLDSGALDNAAILRALRAVGYGGDIGFQGYSIRGDPRATLARSLAAYRAMISARG